LNIVGKSEWIKAIKDLAAGVVGVGPKVGHCINEGDSRTEEANGSCWSR